MKQLWSKFNNHMQEWYEAHLPWSTIAMTGVGLIIGCGFLAITWWISM